MYRSVYGIVTVRRYDIFHRTDVPYGIRKVFFRDSVFCILFWMVPYTCVGSNPCRSSGPTLPKSKFQLKMQLTPEHLKPCSTCIIVSKWRRHSINHYNTFNLCHTCTMKDKKFLCIPKIYFYGRKTSFLFLTTGCLPKINFFYSVGVKSLLVDPSYAPEAAVISPQVLSEKGGPTLPSFLCVFWKWSTENIKKFHS